MSGFRDFFLLNSVLLETPKHLPCGAYFCVSDRCFLFGLNSPKVSTELARIHVYAFVNTPEPDVKVVLMGNPTGRQCPIFGLGNPNSRHW